MGTALAKQTEKESRNYFQILNYLMTERGLRVAQHECRAYSLMRF
jgi:hypothetical protein